MTLKFYLKNILFTEIKQSFLHFHIKHYHFHMHNMNQKLIAIIAVLSMRGNKYLQLSQLKTIQPLQTVAKKDEKKLNIV